MKAILFLIIIFIGLELLYCEEKITSSNWDTIDTVLFANQFYVSMYDVRQTIEWDKSYQRGESKYRGENNPFAVPFQNNPTAFYAVALAGQYMFYNILVNIEDPIPRRLLMVTYTLIEYHALETSLRSIDMVYGWKF